MTYLQPNFVLRVTDLPDLQRELYREDQGEHIDTVLTWVKDNITYAFDSEVWGREEMWMPGHVTVAMGAGDCDDMGILVVYLLSNRPLFQRARLCYGKYDKTDTLHVWSEIRHNGERHILDTVQPYEAMHIRPGHPEYGYYRKTKIHFKWFTWYQQFPIPFPVPRLRAARNWSALDYPTDFR